VPVGQIKQVKNSITAEIETLEKLVARIIKTAQEIEKMVSNGSVVEILEKEEMFMDFDLSLNKLSYLKTLSFELLAKTYHHALLGDNERDLEDFSQYHRDIYNKLKFKAIRAVQHQKIIAPQELEEEKITLYELPDTAKLHGMIQELDNKIKISQQSFNCMKKFDILA
jgi:hypothetical protein